MNQRTGGCRQTWTSRITRKPGRTRFCRLRARDMSGCNLRMCTRNGKKIVSSLPARRTKSLSRIALVTARGRRVLSEKNCTRLAGGLPIYCKKSCKRSVPTGQQCRLPASAPDQTVTDASTPHDMTSGKQRARKSNRKNPGEMKDYHETLDALKDQLAEIKFPGHD